MQKKYLSLERLTEYDALIKGEITSGDAASLTSAKEYTNTEIAKITNGTTVVPNANHANNADHASTADSAVAADSAAKFTTARTITLTGDVSGSVSFDGSSDVSIAVTVADDSHEHIIGNIKNLQDALNGKADKSHSHDDVYYTEAEIDALLAGKSDTSHKHDNDYDAKGAAASALESAKAYADEVKDDLLNGAGEAYDTLKELGELIDGNKGAIEALTEIASGKADAEHDHDIADVTGLQDALNGKADKEHGVHVEYSSTDPVMDGTASAGSATTVARSDHRHPTDTSRASKTEFDTHATDTTAHITSIERTNWNAAKTHADSAHAPSNAQENVIESIKVNGAEQTPTGKSVNIVVPTQASDIGAANASHTHEISEITSLSGTLETASSAILANTSSINAHTDRIAALETKVGEGFVEITSAEIAALFKK